MSKDKADVNNPYLLREVRINRYRDILIFLPILAALFFLSPALNFISDEVFLFGVPAKIGQIFLAWLLIILILRRISRRMQKRLGEREL